MSLSLSIQPADQSVEASFSLDAASFTYPPAFLILRWVSIRNSPFPRCLAGTRRAGGSNLGSRRASGRPDDSADRSGGLVGRRSVITKPRRDRSTARREHKGIPRSRTDPYSRRARTRPYLR